MIPTPDGLKENREQKQADTIEPFVKNLTDMLGAGRNQASLIIKTLEKEDLDFIASLFSKKGWDAKVTVNKSYDQRDRESYPDGFLITIKLP